MLFQTYTKLAFGLSDILIITVIVGNRINSVGFLLQKRKFCFIGAYMPNQP